MSETKRLWLRAIILFCLLVLLMTVSLSVHWREEFTSFLAAASGTGIDKSERLLTVAFLDVGQGDAIYIETPDGVQLLIDGGPDMSVLRALSQVMPFFDRSLDVVLATHSDKDHIGGLVDVLERYQIETIIRTENQNDTEVAVVFDRLAEAEKLQGAHIASAGQQFNLGASTTLMILSPLGNPANWESNSASIVAQLQYGDIAFMLTGDAPIGIEDYLVESYGPILKSEVLKLGHHGSKTSSGELFLKSVAPTFAIVSAEKNSRYGHPHMEVLSRVGLVGSTILSTAETGTIIFKSDGKRVWVE